MSAPDTTHDNVASITKAEHSSAAKAKKIQIRQLDPSDGEYYNVSVRTTGSRTPLDVAIVDSSGNQISTFGGGTQYTEGDVDATITGTAALAEGTSNTLTPLQLDSSGNLKVNIQAGAGSGGTAMADDAAFTVASTSLTPVGGVVTSDTVDAGDAGAFAMLANRQQKVTLYDSSGVELSVGGGTQYDEDTAHVSGDKVTLAGVVRNDVRGALSGTDGDRTVLQTNSSGDLRVDGSAVTQPVSASSLPLPTGAATSANQTTIIGHVDGIEGLLTTIDADTGNLPTIETNTDFGTVTGGGTETGALRVTIANNSTGVLSVDDNGSTLSVDDGGSSLTVDGTVGVSGTVAVTQSGTWDEVGINDSGNSITVDAPLGTPVNVQVGDGTNTATVRNLASNDALNVAITDASGNQITSFGGGTQYTEGDTDATITGTAVMWEDAADTLKTVSAADPLPVEIVAGAGSGGTASADDADFTAGTTSGTPAMGVYESTPSSVTDGDMGIVGITANREIKVSPPSITQGAGAVGATTPRMTLASDDPAVVALQTIDNAISGSEMQVDVVTSALPTGASTSANQSTIIGHLDGVEGLLTTIDTDTGNVAAGYAAEGAALGSGVLMQGDDGTDRTNVLVDTDGHLQVDVLTGGGGGTQYTEGDTDATITGTAMMMEGAGNSLVAAQGTAADGLLVNLGANNDVTVTGTVTANLAAGTNNIGDVDVVSSALPTGASTSANQTTIIGHLDGVEGLLTTIDADTGNLPTIETNTDFGTVTGGGTETGALRVTIANNSTGVLSVDDNGSTISIDDGGGAITVDGTITANLAAGTNNIGDVDVLTINGQAPAFGSGTRSAATQRVTIATDDIVPASQSGTWTVQPGNTANTTPWLISPRPATSGGLTIFRSIDIDETEEEIKGTAGQLFSITAFNRTAAPLYLKFYNGTAASVTVGTTTPVLTFVVPANADSDGAGFVWNNEHGLAFSTAMTVACTTGVADNDVGAPGANDCVLNVGYA